MAATAASRVLGLVREQVMLAVLGLNAGMGAFTVAFKVPSLVRTLLADTALSAAFIPVFSELLEKGRRAEAWMVARTIILLATLDLGQHQPAGDGVRAAGHQPGGAGLQGPRHHRPGRGPHPHHVPQRGRAGRGRGLHGHPEHPRPLHPPGFGSHRLEPGHHRVACLLLAAVWSAAQTLPVPSTTGASTRWPGASCSAPWWSWPSRCLPCGGGWKAPPGRWHWVTRRCVR